MIDRIQIFILSCAKLLYYIVRYVNNEMKRKNNVYNNIYKVNITTRRTNKNYIITGYMFISILLSVIRSILISSSTIYPCKMLTIYTKKKKYIYV